MMDDACGADGWKDRFGFCWMPSRFVLQKKLDKGQASPTADDGWEGHAYPKNDLYSRPPRWKRLFLVRLVLFYFLHAHAPNME